MLRTLCQATLISKDNSSSQAIILGRRERFDVMNAAFVNGVSSHIFDFDDTHPKTTIHPAGPVIRRYLRSSNIIQYPMTDANLVTKFSSLAEGSLATQQIHELIDLCLGC